MLATIKGFHAVNADNDESFHQAVSVESDDYFFDIDLMDTKVLQNDQAEMGEAMNIVDDENKIQSQSTSESSYESLQCNAVGIDENHNEEKTVLNLELVNSSSDMSSNSQQIVDSQSNSQMRVAFAIVLRLVLPLANGVARSIKVIRDVRFLRILNAIASSRQALTNLLAFAANTISMNLSSVQVSNRIEPLLKLMKIRKPRHAIESLPDIQKSESSTPTLTPNGGYSPSSHLKEPTWPSFSGKPSLSDQQAAKCCTLQVLAEPPPGEEIRTDVIFIHGLHGSLVNTWRQGLWENDRRPVEFQRPPKPPICPPKRARHSRSTCIRPPHKHKRARFAHLEEVHRQAVYHETNDEFEENRANDSFTYESPRDIRVYDGIEHSFPTFRIRMNDDRGRLLSAEIKTNPNPNPNPNLNHNATRDSNDMSNKKDAKQGSKTKTKPKITVNDPNYSKCWPRDWLPLDCPGVRVIAVNYTTERYLWRPLWMKKETRSNLVQRAREMAELLIEQKVGHGHPIVWVGHSKGGLFVKQIIVDAWESGRPAMAPLWRSARGVFFYSVPHRGSHLANLKAPFLARSVELLDIEKNSKYLLDLHRRFAGLYYLGQLKVEVFSFVETALTLMSVLYLRIVGVDSADPGIGDVCGIRLDHREICKPRSRDCILYKELVKMIKKVS